MKIRPAFTTGAKKSPPSPASEPGSTKETRSRSEFALIPAAGAKLQSLLAGNPPGRPWNADFTGLTGGRWDVLHATDFQSPRPFWNSLLRGINNTVGLGAVLVNTVNNVGGTLLIDLPALAEEQLRSTLGTDFNELAVLAQSSTPLPFDDLLFSGLAQLSEGSARLRIRMYPAEIHLGGLGLAHVTERHLEGWPTVMPKSLFFRGLNLEALIRKAERTPVLQQSNHHLLRIVDAKGFIGIDRVTGKPTSIYTVVTDLKNTVFTMFPGKPKHLGN